MGSRTKGHTPADLIALTVLALLLEQPRHPYEMQRLMHERRKDYAAGRTRSFYDAITRLQQAGLVEPQETSREGRRPERTVYRITDEGREEFPVWLGDLLGNPVAEYPVFTVVISLLAYLSPTGALKALQERAVALEGLLGGLQAGVRALEKDLHLPRLYVLEREHVGVLYQAELSWVRRLIDDMRAGRLTWPAMEDWPGQQPEKG